MHNNRLMTLLEEISSVPNPPFLLQPRLDWLKRILKASEIRMHIINNAAILLLPTTIPLHSIKNTKGVRKIVLMSHIDHPGFIYLPEQPYLLPLGTLYLHKLREGSSYPIRLVSSNGKPLGVIESTLQNHKLTPKEKIKSAFPLFAQWHFHKTFDKSETSISMFSADNDLPTVILLQLLTENTEVITELYRKYRILVIGLITLVEEVLQLSSFMLARKNMINITPDDSIINLESMKLLDDIPQSDRKHYDDPEYGQGVVISPTELGITYNLGVRKRNNIYEFLKQTPRTQQLRTQFKRSAGSTDAWPWAYFARTANIITINMPNKYKHNVNPKTGDLTLEKISGSDIETAYTLLSLFITQQLPNYIGYTEHSRTLPQEAPFADHITDKKWLDYRACVALRLSHQFSNPLNTAHVLDQLTQKTLNSKIVKYYSWLKFFMCKLLKQAPSFELQ